MFFHSGFCQCDRIHVFYLHGAEETARTSFVTAVHSVLILLELCYRRKVSSLAAITTVSSELLPCLSVSSSSHLNFPGALENRHCTVMLFWLLTDPKMRSQRCCYICTAATFATGQ